MPEEGGASEVVLNPSAQDITRIQCRTHEGCMCISVQGCFDSSKLQKKREAVRFVPKLIGQAKARIDLDQCRFRIRMERHITVV